MRRNKPSFFQEVVAIWRIIKPFWQSEVRYKAFAMLLTILSVNALIVYGLIALNSWNNKFFNALQSLNQEVFFRQALLFIPLLLGIVFLYNMNYYLMSRLALFWRQWLSNHFIGMWLHNNNFYRIMQVAEAPDNPDQRISEDLYSFTRDLLKLVVDLFREILSVVSFSVLLWNFSSYIDLSSYVGYQLMIPGLLFWLVIIYCLISTIVTVLIGRSLISLDYMQEKYEANFRYGLIRIRDKREEIALYNAADSEHLNLKEYFVQIRDNFTRIINRNVILDFWRNIYYYSDQAIPFLAMAPMYFIGKINLGTLMQVASAFGQFKRSLSTVITHFPQITSWIATARRLEQLRIAMASTKLAYKTNKVVLTHSNVDVLECDELYLTRPDGSKLVDNFSMKLMLGEKLMIEGRSGVGKSTLIKAIAGLWPYGSGNITLPYGDILYLPQKPYMPVDNLRTAILYPGRSKTEDRVLISWLKRFDLAHLVSSLEIVQDWSMILSLGEQQRIAIIRALINQPQWLVMDEPNSALDEYWQEQVFVVLNEHLSASTWITISHDAKIKKYHDYVHELRPAGEVIGS